MGVGNSGRDLCVLGEAQRIQTPTESYGNTYSPKTYEEKETYCYVTLLVDLQLTCLRQNDE